MGIFISMSFANTYIEKQQVYPFQINQKIEDLAYCIVIPAYNEPDIITTLNSIWNCIQPASVFAVIICINSNNQTSSEILEQNETTFRQLEKWISKHKSWKLHFFITHFKNIPYKYRGAGMARKLAMDEAVNLFNKGDNPNGIIISLDADVEVEKNYLVEIETFYTKNKKAIGAVHYFEHPVSGSKFSEEQYKAIINYELYLRYFNQSMRYTGFPYIHHTVGSCFSVKAKTYVAQGGMNRQHAGEDFYFIQKIAQLGNFGEINSTTIYPSPRVSDRVPFGTGPEIKNILNCGNDEYLVPNFESFIDLKSTLHIFQSLYGLNNIDVEKSYHQLPASIKLFISQDELTGKINEVNKNTSSETSFIKRLLNWFNVFKMIKFLNFIHENEFYKKEDVLIGAQKLLHAFESKKEIDSKKEMLNFFRELDNSGFYYTNLLQQ